MSLPMFNPLFAPTVVCRKCGKEMDRENRVGPRGRIEAIIYTCLSPECEYTVESDMMLHGEAKPIKKAVIAR